MIVLHAGVFNARLHIWGEKSLGSESKAGKRTGRRTKTPQVETLPYDAGPEGLSDALEKAGTSFLPGTDDLRKLFIWAPSIKGAPVASSPLIAEPPESDEPAVLSPWQITAFSLSWMPAVGFLCSCSGKEVLTAGVIPGKDLLFLTKAMQFAGAMVARQQFMPSLDLEAEGWYARWTPVFAGPDSNRLSTLARAMPASCRALTSDALSPPGVSPPAILRSFIAGMVDQLVRSSISEPQRGSIVGIRGKKKLAAFDSVHDQWLHALRSSDGRMDGSDAELVQLVKQIKDWHRPVAVPASTAFRLCFRLEEPQVDEESAPKRKRSSPAKDWKVQFLLQAADDPSLLIPAKEAWSPRGRRAAILKRDSFDAREYLISALGQASGLCPNIEASLKAAAPGGYSLDTQGAYEFLTERVWALEQAGFGLLLPAWWTRKGARVKLAARAKVKSPKMQGKGKLSLDQILRFDWEMALGDETISRKELEALAQFKAPLVKVRGQWVQVNADEIQAALEFWKKNAAGEATVRDVIRMAIGAERSFGGVPFEGVSATGWVGELLKRLEGGAAFEALSTPEGFHGMLRPYQIRGYSWLGFLHELGLGACLADDMGLGKTIQTLALIQRDWESDGKKPVLLICPMSVVNNWRKESTRFTPDLPVMIHHGSVRTKGGAFKTEAKKQAIVISSYALLHRDFGMFKDVPWAGVVLDEAQNIKNPETKQAKAARALQADYRIALTGTPVENNVGDLWSLMEFLNPGFLGSQSEFKRNLFIPIQANRDLEAMGRLKRLTGPFILRRLKTDRAVIADLPDKIENRVFCTLTKEQASLYEAVVQDAAKALDDSEGIQRKGVVLATLSKLKQVCNHPAQFLDDNSPIPDRSGKLSRLGEMIEEVLEAGDSALIFSQFSEMGEILQRYLQDAFGREVLFLHGGVTKKRRDRMVERFQQENDGPRLFILSLKAGGTGLNLTRASHVFHYDRWWNPAVENQATDRAFRIGQKKNVQVYKYICAGTLEEKIDEMIRSKLEVSEGVVGAGESWLTELSTAELKKIFELGKDAVAE